MTTPRLWSRLRWVWYQPVTLPRDKVWHVRYEFPDELCLICDAVCSEPSPCPCCGDD